MRRSFNPIWMLCISLAVVLLTQTSCSDDESDRGVAAILNAGKATSHSISFTITPQYAEKCTWVCVKKGETVPTAEEILNIGVPADISQTTSQTAIALEAKTEYVIIAAAIRNGRSTLSVPLEMSTLEKTEIPEDVESIKLKVLVDAIYGTNNATAAGNYVVSLASTELGQDGYPARVGDIMIQVDLYNAIDADPVNATLPSGEYLPGNQSLPFTWNPSQSIIYSRTGAGSQGVAATLLSDGSVTVEREGDIYSIQIDAVNLSGKKVRAYYTGPIMFVQTGTSSYERFNTPQNVTFDRTMGRYYGNWFRPHADDWSLKFYKGTFDSYNRLTDGYCLNLYAYMHKLVDYNVATPLLEEGTYTVRKTSSLALTSIPHTLDPGIFSDDEPVDAYLTRIDGATGKKYIGLITSGTMKVTHSGDQYIIDFDFKSQEGISIKGSFSGALTVKNFNDTDIDMYYKPHPWSSLTENQDLNFPNDAVAEAIFLGEYLYPGLNSWWFLLSAENNDKGDMITAEFFTPKEKGMQLVPGTYTLSREFEAYNLMPGFRQRGGGGEVVYTWYGDLSSQDSQGYSDKLAPIEEGTMVVEQQGDNYKFIFDFKDDAGHTIKGEWTGPVKIEKHESAVTKSKRSMPGIMLKKR